MVLVVVVLVMVVVVVVKQYGCKREAFISTTNIGWAAGLPTSIVQATLLVRRSIFETEPPNLSVK